MFRDINGYPNWITEQTVKKVKNQNEMIRSAVVTTLNVQEQSLPIKLFG